MLTIVRRNIRPNCILKQELRRYEPRSRFPQKSPFRAHFRVFYPHPANKSALRAEGASHVRAPGKRGWPATSPWPLICRDSPLPPLTSLLSLRAPCLRPRFGFVFPLDPAFIRTKFQMCKRLTLEQFGFVSALFYLHQFAPFRFAGHYAVAPRFTPHQRDQVVRRLSPAGYCLTPTTDLSKTERDPIATSGPTIPVWHQTGRSLRKKQSVCPGSPPLDRSLTAGGAQRQSLQACLPMAISRNSCSLLDFPEFAQAVRYGVPELTWSSEKTDLSGRGFLVLVAAVI